LSNIYQTKGRIPALDVVRAIAAVGIVLYHYCIFFFKDQAFSAKLSFFPPLDFSDNSFANFLEDFPFDFGRFFVSLFFLLSGFLLPYLAAHYPTRRAFLKNRFFRLWPAYIGGLLVNVLFIWGACVYNNFAFPFSGEALLASFFCLRDVLGYPYITGVVWTFEIEIKFVVFCALFYPLCKKVVPELLLGVKAVLFCLAIALLVTVIKYESDGTLFLFTIFKALADNLKFFCFIFLGFVLSLFYQKRITFRRWIWLSLGLLVLFGLENAAMVRVESVFSYMLSYTPGWLFFVIYTWPTPETAEAPKKHPLFSFIADVSYPLYLVHAIPGYIVMYMLYDQGVSFWISIPVVFLMSMVLAVVLHKTIEAPLRSFGRLKPR